MSHLNAYHGRQKCRKTFKDGKELTDSVGGGLNLSLPASTVYSLRTVISLPFYLHIQYPKIKTELKLLLQLNIFENKLILKILKELLCYLNLNFVDPSKLTITQLATNK